MPSNQPYRCRKMTLNMTATNSGSPDSDTESNLDNVDDNDEDIWHATARRGTTERPATARERANQLAQRVYGCPAPRPRRDGNGVPLPRRPNPQRLKRKYASPRESRAHERFIRKEQLNLLGIDGGPRYTSDTYCPDVGLNICTRALWYDRTAYEQTLSLHFGVGEMRTH